MPYKQWKVDEFKWPKLAVPIAFIKVICGTCSNLSFSSAITTTYFIFHIILISQVIQYDFMVTRPTNHMICSHDPDTWPTNFILILSHHWYHHPCYHFHIMTTSRPFICHTTTTSSHHHSTRRLSFKDLVWALNRVLLRPTRKTTSRLMPVLESGGGSLIEGKCPWLLQQKEYFGSHEWSSKGRWLAERGLAWPFGISTSASTISPYYSMSRGEDKVVTRECLVTKLSRRRSSAWPLDGPARLSAKEIQMHDLYKAYQEISW